MTSFVKILEGNFCRVIGDALIPDHLRDPLTDAERMDRIDVMDKRFLITEARILLGDTSGWAYDKIKEIPGLFINCDVSTKIVEETFIRSYRSLFEMCEKSDRSVTKFEPDASVTDSKSDASVPDPSGSQLISSMSDIKD